MDQDALDLVPVADLRDALLRRHDHVVIAVLSEAEGELSLTWGWKGDAHKVVGIIEEVKVRMFTQREAER